MVEALIAIAIITLTIGGPLYAASRSLNAANNAKDRLIASYLAQEGIEYVRRMRDNMYLQGISTGSLPDIARCWNFNPATQDGLTTLSQMALCYFANADGSVTTAVSSCVTNSGNNELAGGDGQVSCALDPSLDMGADGSFSANYGAGRSLQVCTSPTVCPLYRTPDGEYVLDADLANTETPFTRLLTFYGLPGSEIQVKSEVTWTSAGVDHAIEYTTYLSSWQ